MKPILLEWGPIRIGSYGVLLALAFLSSIAITNREFRRNQADADLAWDIYLMAMVGGLVGSRGLFLIENWHQFLREPLGLIFSASGFSVIGGYVLALGLCIIRIRRSPYSFIRMADLCVPGMAVGYAVGRLGCITAGDGCYGLPTTGPFGMCFPNGLVPTLSEKNGFLREKFIALFPGTPVPADIPVLPTPLFESLSQWTLLALLLFLPWQIGRGRRFGFFLLWFGVSRFLVEFIRLNPLFMWGLTSDQFLAAVFALLGGIFLLYPPGSLMENPISATQEAKTAPAQE
jgi:phosphatidylglycerol:prolipoprotein diacylglycerol transferase